MPGIVCATCHQSVPLSLDGRLPPWCTKCGGDFKGTTLTAGEGAPEPFDPYADIKRRLPKEIAAPAPAAGARKDLGWRPEDEGAHGEAMAKPPGRSASFNFGLMLIAGGFLLVCAYLTNRSVEKVSNHKLVQGQVSGYTYTRKGFRMCQVSYSYNGQTYQITGQSGSHEIGITVPVMVTPDSPADGTVKSFSDLWLGPLITGVLGGACLLFFLIDLRGS